MPDLIEAWEHVRGMSVSELTRVRAIFNNNFIVSNLNSNAGMPDLLDEKGHLNLLPASEYDKIPHESLRLWCHKNARYGLPTAELVQWVREFIGGRSAIEIGAGSGDLGYHLGITTTDSKIQAEPEVALMYKAMGQPTVVYPSWVEKLEALDAIRKYRPQVVVAQWVTHWIDPSLPPPPGGGCMFGPKEDKILAEGVTYLMIGNRRIHGSKPILKFPHQELRLPFIRSRASFPDEDVVYIWEPQK